jgi:hypothetical protein
MGQGQGGDKAGMERDGQAWAGTGVDGWARAGMESDWRGWAGMRQ